MTKFDPSIDENQLEKEWVTQPEMFHDVALALAEAKDVYAKAKARIDVVKAEVDLEFQRDPEAFGFAKVTVALAKTVVDSDVRVVKTIREAIDAKHEVDVLDAAVFAMDHRKKALESLVSLWLADYFSTPRADKASTQKLDDKRKREVRSRGRRRKAKTDDDE